MRRYAKFVTALLGAVVVVGNQLLPVVHGTAHTVVTVAASIATALGVYVAPYEAAIPPTAETGRHTMEPPAV